MSFKPVLITIGGILFLLLVFLPFLLGGRFKTSSGPANKGVGIFKSIDGGTTWALKTRVDESGITFPVNVASFTFHPTESNVIFLGTKGAGLWVSQNEGESWARAIDTKGTLKLSAEIYDISVNRSRPEELYLAVFQDNLGMVLKSSDGGRSFEEVYRLPDRFGVFGVYVDPEAPYRVYVATGQGGFFESSDGGKSWKVQRWFPDGLVRLVSNPSDGANYFVVTSHGEMFRTYDRGVSWTRLTEGFRQFPKADRIAGVALDIMNPSTLYTASPYGLLRSQNGGTTWSSANLIVPPQSSGANAVTVNPKNSRQIFAAVGAQIYRSDDFGEHWGILNSPTSDQIRMIYVDPEDTSIVYAVVGR